jgi:proteasome lid subunit RPN8/RPN11
MLPRVLYEEMLAQARAELPNECCGMLAGRIEPAPGDSLPRAFVLRRLPLVNAAASPVEYLSDDKSMFQAVRSMDREGLDTLAVYHSHPTSDPVPSRKDREQNYSTNVVNLIISLKGPEPLMRGWWLTAEDYREADWLITDG